MKNSKLFLALLFFVFINVFTKAAEHIPVDSTFKIYLAKNELQYNSETDYSKLNLDTVALSETPFLSFDDIESYDTISHIIDLKFPADSLDYPSSISINGRMFVVVANDEAVYCGFFWTPASSLPCHWVTIVNSNQSGALSEMQIQISAGYPSNAMFKGVDPRNSTEIFANYQQNETLVKVFSTGDDNFKVYPNPTSGKITYMYRKKSNKTPVSLYDIHGKLLKTIEPSYESNEIDIHEFPVGVYFLRTKTRKAIKVIKQ